MSEETQEKVSVVGEPALADQIADDLAKSEETKEEGVPQSTQPAPPINLADLTTEQLQALKSALSATPDRASTADQTKVVKVRRVEDKYVVDFKPAKLVYMMDETQTRKVETHIIPVKLEGATEFTDMRYKSFMQSEQVDCKVKQMHKKEVPIVEGETYDEHDRLVEMTRMEVQYTFDVTTPEGRELTIEGKIANA